MYVCVYDPTSLCTHPPPPHTHPPHPPGASGKNTRKVSAVEATLEGVSTASTVTNEKEWVFELTDTDSD